MNGASINLIQLVVQRKLLKLMIQLLNAVMRLPLNVRHVRLRYLNQSIVSSFLRLRAVIKSKLQMRQLPTSRRSKLRLLKTVLKTLQPQPLKTSQVAGYPMLISLERPLIFSVKMPSSSRLYFPYLPSPWLIITEFVRGFVI